MKKLNIDEYIGKNYGRWAILSEAQGRMYSKGLVRYVNCQCSCGTLKKVDLNSLKRGKSTSCGCYNKEVLVERQTTHGLAMLSTGIRHLDYCIWMKIKSRCLNKNDKSYKHYGGRGIKICDRWKDSFKNFIDDIGWRPDNSYSIEREDYNGNYEPSNCKWILKSKQSLNNRRVKKVLYNGKKHVLSEVCRELGVNYSTMRHRVYDLKIPFQIAINYHQHYKFTKDKLKIIK
jgi:hypothetical protein